MVAQVYTVAILAVFAQAVFAATCSRTYTIVEGDYCDKISQEQNVSTFQLAAINPDINKDCTNLTPGKPICLGFSGEDCSTTQVVQPDDTCSGIAAANGLNLTILKLNNPQLDQSCHIYVGEVLCISNTVQVPAIPASGITVTVGTDQSAPVSTIIPNEVPSPTAVASPVDSPTPTVDNTSPSAPTPTDNGGDPNAPNNLVDNTIPPASTLTDNGGDPNDEDLPFCDEL